MAAPLEKLNDQSLTNLSYRNNPAIKEMRKHQRVPLSIPGRFMLEDKTEYPCQVVNMSPGGVAILAPNYGRIGERIVCYLETLGRLEGFVVRHFGSGFSFTINASPRKRERLAEQLMWLSNKDNLDLDDERDHQRVVPKNSYSQIAFSDGRVSTCRIINVSMSGLGIQVNEKPAIGENVVIGKTACRIVRHFENGIGAEFSRAPSEQIMSDFL